MYGRCTCGWASAPGTVVEARHAIAAHHAEVDACKRGCELGQGHDGDCMDGEDVAEAKLMARDYTAWSRL